MWERARVAILSLFNMNVVISEYLAPALDFAVQWPLGHGSKETGFVHKPCRMSALGQKRTLGGVRSMSALADIGTQPRDVCSVPKADIAGGQGDVGSAPFALNRYARPSGFLGELGSSGSIVVHETLDCIQF